jgi:hypothetical protein
MKNWTSRIRMSAVHNDVTVRSAQGEEITFERNGLKPADAKALLDGLILGFFGKQGLASVKRSRYNDWKDRQHA